MFIHNSWFNSLTFSFQTINALMYANEIFRIMISLNNSNWLLSQIFIYAVLILLIIILQNVFLIIIGDGYIKSKYFHKNNWVKVGDDALFHDKKEDAEDPLECFNEHNEKAEKSKAALVKMLKADKEFLLTEYYASRGIKYSPHIYDESKREKSPEELYRSFESQIDKVLQEYNKIKESIQEDPNITDEDAKEERKIILDKLNGILEALDFKLDKVHENLKHF